MRIIFDCQTNQGNYYPDYIPGYSIERDVIDDMTADQYTEGYLIE